MQCFAILNDWMFLVDLVNVNSQKNFNLDVGGHRLTAMFCF